VFGITPIGAPVSSEQTLQLMHPEDREAVVAARARRLQGHTPTSVDFRLLRPDGTECFAHSESEVLCDEAGRPVRIVGTVQDVTERRRAEQELLTYQEQLRSLAAELSLAEERERRRLAAGLHDRIGQALAVCAMKMDVLQRSATSPELAQELRAIGKLTDQALQATQSLTFELSPPILYDLGLEPALDWLAEQMQQQHGLEIRVRDLGGPRPLSEEVRTVLFRAVRELLFNVVKHARAGAATVTMRRTGDGICVEVKDDGMGFDASKTSSASRKTGGFGLFNIRERLAHLGGSVTIESKPGCGTLVALIAPLLRDAPTERGTEQ
jgi:signal transduction histidine kinase